MGSQSNGSSFIVDGQISNGQFVTHKNNEKWIEISLPDLLMISTIKFFASGVCCCQTYLHILKGTKAFQFLMSSEE